MLARARAHTHTYTHTHTHTHTHTGREGDLVATDVVCITQP